MNDHTQMIVAMKRAKWNGLSTGGRLNAALSTLYGELHARLCFKVHIHYTHTLIYNCTVATAGASCMTVSVA
jgi:hypothetical protein